MIKNGNCNRLQKKKGEKMKPLNEVQRQELRKFKSNGGRFNTFHVVVVVVETAEAVEIEKEIGRVVAAAAPYALCQFSYCPAYVQFDKGCLQYVAMKRAQSINLPRANERVRKSVAMKYDPAAPLIDQLKRLILDDQKRKPVRWMKDVTERDLV